MFCGGNFLLAILAVEEERLQRNAVFRRLRIDRQNLRDTSDPFHLDSEYFRKLYRVPPHAAQMLIELLYDHIREQGIGTIPAHLQVLCVLRFFAEGGYQKGVGQDINHPVSQSTVSRCLTRVVNALVAVADRFIRFPQTRQERQRVQQDFLQYIRIPGILGIMDCVLVSSVRPCLNEEAFYNYKGFHAMNVQIVSDANYIIQAIRICPGSNNDRYVWQYSDVKEHLEDLRANAQVTREEGRYYILADSGYTPSPIILTPLRHAPEGSPAARFTEELVGIRCKVEQLFGLWTNVWRSIKRERKLCYRDPEKVSRIITACAVLHNFNRMHGEPNDVELMDPNLDNREENGPVYGLDYQAGIAERDRIINEYYN